MIVGGLTYLYYEHGDGTELRVVTSPDGITFGNATTVLVGPDVHAPAAVHLDDGSVVLYYERGDGLSVGLATGQPLGMLRDDGDVLTPTDVEVGDATPGTAFWTPVLAIHSPHALLAGPPGAQTIHVWFSAFGTESAPAMQFGVITPIDPNYSVGFADAAPTSPAALVVWPYGPVVDHVESFLDHHDDFQPGVVGLDDGTWFLYDVDAVPAAAGDVGLDGPFTLGRLEALSE